MKQTWKKMGSLFLVVCMILTMLPTSVFAANIGMGQIYFGKNSSGFPILWYIVATDANSVTLWTPADMGSKSYDSSEHDSWSGSDICTWLNGTFLDDAFTSAEQDAIAAYGSTEDPDSIDISQKIVLPSVAEMGTGSSAGMWKIDQNSRASADNWWLRTPGASDNVAVYVKSDGEVLVAGDNVSNTHAICPALKLDVSSILFGTAAADGKSRSIGPIAKVVAPSGAMKATVVDSSIATPSLTLAAESNGTNAIKFAYSSAKTGANQYLSCALLHSNTLEYYGKLANCASTSSGEVTFPTSGVGQGTYEMEIFCEQVNADSFSDFASAPVGTMTLTVDADGKGTVSGTGFSSDDSTSPVLSGGSVNRTSDTEAEIGFTTNEDGTAFYTAVEKDASAPDKNTVAAGTSIGSVSGTVANLSVALTAGAKDIYVVVKDAAGNISDPLKIEAATYIPPDIIAPELSAGSVNRTSDTEATIGFTTNEDGTAFYAAVKKDASAPDKNTVAAGTSIGSVSGTVVTQSVALTAGAKDIYVVVKDAAGNISDPLKIEAADYVPPDIIAPELSAGSVNRTSDTEATIGFTTNEDGTAFYTVVEKDASAPDKNTVAAGTSIGSVSGTVANQSVTLTAGAKDIYVVVKDAAGNISDPLKIQAVPYVPPIVFVANEAELKDALASTVSSDIRVQTSITLWGAAEVKANHTLIVANTLKTRDNGSINVGSHTLTVKGGGTLSAETRNRNLFETEFGQDPHGTLNLENITVNLKNSDDHNAGGISELTINMNTGAVIHVNSVRGFMPDDLTVNSGATLNVTTSPGTSAVALGGVMHINGGTVSITSGVIEAYSNVKLKYTSGTLTGSNGGSINVSNRCKIEGMANQFKDRAILFSNSSEVTVDVENDLPSASGLTVGEYLWDGTCFAKTSQIIWGETTANGVANTSDTTELTLCFANNPRALTADHIKVTGATKGILSGSGMIRTLAISNITVAEGEEVTVEITAPDGYSVTTPSKTVAVHKAAIVTDTTAPVLSGGSANRTSDTVATIGFTTDEAGTAYYSVVDKDASAPDKNVVATGTSLGTVSGTVTNASVTLTAGDKDIYVVVKDEADNISEPLKIAAAAYVSSAETLANTLTLAGFIASASGNTVTVTGTVSATDTLSLKIPTGVKVLWNASLTGAVDGPLSSLVFLNGDGTFELAGGEITNTGTGMAVAGIQGSMVISGGTASSSSDVATVNAFHTGPNPMTLTMTGGTVTSTSTNVSSSAISAGGNTVITGGTITAASGNQVFLNNAVVVYRSGLLTAIASTSLSASIAVDPSKTYATPTETAGLTATGYSATTGNVTAHWAVLYSGEGTGVWVDYTYSGTGSGSWRVSYPAVKVVGFRQELTYDANGGSGSMTGSTVYYGQSYTVSANAFTRTNYNFTGWNTQANGKGTAYAAGAILTGADSSDPITLYAQWSPTGNGSNPGAGGLSTAAAPASTVSGFTATTTATATTDTNGKTTASVTESQMKAALAKAKAAAGTSETPAVIIKVGGASHASSVGTSIPRASVQALASGSGALTISSPTASVSFDAAALKTIFGAASGDVTVTASKVDASTLSDVAKQTVSSHPVYQFTVASGGKTISQFGGTVTASVPYTPVSGEDVDAIVVYYIAADGSLETVTNGRYDAATGTVVFTTDHFSTYAVGYNKVSFTDISDTAWYFDAVTYLAARNITGGTAATTFSPGATLTRGQFITLLLRAYGIEAAANSSDNFADAGSTYYTGYLAAAKSLGITSGVGDNKFAPDSAITRQEMFTLLYHALKAINALPTGTSNKTLSEFSDASGIASWAKDAMTYFVEAGTISGSGGKLSPTVTTTRAEMAQVLYNLLTK